MLFPHIYQQTRSWHYGAMAFTRLRAIATFSGCFGFHMTPGVCQKIRRIFTPHFSFPSISLLKTRCQLGVITEVWLGG